MWSCRYTVDASDLEGAVTFNITYQDAAGNVGLVETEADITDQTRVLVDHTAPSLQMLVVTVEISTVDLDLTLKMPSGRAATSY